MITCQTNSKRLICFQQVSHICTCVILTCVTITLWINWAKVKDIAKAELSNKKLFVVDEDINEKQVETMNYMFNNKLKGQPIETIDRPLEEYLYDEMTYSVNVIKPVIEQIKKVLEEDNKIYLEGANKSFDLPEFNSLEVAKNFINILDKKEMVADMLDSGFAEDIKVYIGEENEKEQLKDFSVVTFKHKVNGKDLGTIGIIGPKRMDYSKVISVMKYINQKLNGKSN